MGIFFSLYLSIFSSLNKKLTITSIFILVSLVSFSQTLEKIDKVESIKVSSLTKSIESDSQFQEVEIVKTQCASSIAVFIGSEEYTYSQFNVFKRSEVSRLVSRNLYDMVSIIKQ